MRAGASAVRVNSLALRLFLSATAVTVVILLITGIVLSSFYRDSAERSFDSRILVYLKTLVADVAAPDESEKFTQTLGEPMFELPLSGWYWQVTKLNTPKPDVRSSHSLWDTGLPHLEEQNVPQSADGTRRRFVPGPEDQRLRQIERTVDLGDDGRYLVVVAGDALEVEEEIQSFNRAIFGTLGVLAIVLLLTTMFQVRFGLAPLKRISDSLAAIRSGSAERLQGSFPEEIAPLARETNALLDANREIVERARTHVGNLAHALKTPLSVMMNEARGDEPLAVKVREQANVMRDQVQRHLERARIAARANVVGTVTEVSPVVTALARSMEKIHRDRGIAIDIETSRDTRFRGERPDLEEMVGNLVDNACKWAQSRVAVEVLSERAESLAVGATLRVVVDDDGPGLTASERERVARRGDRLDETKPGSGLGLSIVVDLAALYGGALTLGTAPIGGLRAELVLPAA
jgi:signal transduction histidine kinase